MKVLITGASGFIGKRLCLYLKSRGFDVFVIVRRPVSFLQREKQIVVSELTDVDGIDVINIDAVVHLAAKVHDLKTQKSSEYHNVNVLGTKSIRDYANRCGAEHFVFLSSIKALGEKTTSQVFDEQTVPSPEDDYGRSKREAEVLLEQGAAQSKGMKVSVIRVPLVYGTGVKANFLSLLKLVNKTPVLPFGAFDNKRSILGLENLIDFIELLLTSHKKLGSYNHFCIADESPLSTKELTSIMKQASGNKRLVQLFIPVIFLKFIFRLLGRQLMMKRLSEDLVVSWEKANKELSWKPRFSTLELIRKI